MGCAEGGLYLDRCDEVLGDGRRLASCVCRDGPNDHKPESADREEPDELHAFILTQPEQDIGGARGCMCIRP